MRLGMVRNQDKPSNLEFSEKHEITEVQNAKGDWTSLDFGVTAGI